MLLQRVDRLLSEGISRGLKTFRVKWEIHAFEKVTSTNNLAYDMARNGAREGVVVIAECQTRGRGRMKRSWVSPYGRNLYLSLILRPPIPPRLGALLTYLGAISTTEALSESFSLEVGIKWPNDIVVRGRKLAGLLNEVKTEADRVDFVILGFGVNLNMDLETLPEGLRENATSVMMELGHRVPRVEFTQYLLERIDTWYDVFLRQGADPILKRWESVASIRGKCLEVESFGTVHRGVVEGLDADGALILRKRQDERIRIVAGDVTKVEIQHSAVRGQLIDK